jgi:hypothetical protein
MFSATSIGLAAALYNGRRRDVRSSPQTIARKAQPCPPQRTVLRESNPAPEPALERTQTMKTDRPDSNAELSQTFEPLRYVFAIGALLLGFLASVRF